MKRPPFRTAESGFFVCLRPRTSSDRRRSISSRHTTGSFPCDPYHFHNQGARLPSLYSHSHFSSDVSSFIVASDVVKEFEPQTDWTALGTFSVIMIVFALLVRRTAAVEQAVMERDAALTVVRQLKSRELEESDAASALQEALGRYEVAVLAEERLRNIVPGVVRIVPPSSGNAAEEVARDAAKQFLGKDYDIGVPKREDIPNGKLPMIALGILALLGISLTALLFLLSMDPMMASSFLDDL